MKKFLLIFLFIFTFFVSLYGGVLSLTYIDPLNNLNYTNYLEIYDNKKNLIYHEIKGKETTYIPYKEINPSIILCFVNLEDKRFFEHNGFDYIRILKAILNNVSQGDLKAEGASSISQQTARTLFLNTDKNWMRKLKEAFYTMKLENSLTKEEILEIYLNNIFFGGDLYGIEAASKYYFNLSSKNLSLSQCAFLAAILHSPNTYYNGKNLDKSLKRKDLVLELLYENKKIDKTQLEISKKETLEFDFLNNNTPSNLNYYKDSVIWELKKLGYNVENVMKEGIRVYTYLDWDMYNEINKLINELKNELTNLELSLVIMKTDSPQVLSIFGGKDYQESSYNRAIYSKRQVGSTIKPLLYYLALINGFTPISKLRSERTVFRIKDYGVYSPINYGDIYPNRDITMLEAIATSDNIYAVKTMLYIGSRVLQQAISLFAEEENNLPSLALGTSEMTLIQLINMYHTFASLGKKYTPSFIKKIETFDGKIIYTNPNIYKDVLSYNHLLVLASSLLSPYDINLYKTIKPTMLNYPTIEKYATKTGSTKFDNYAIGYNRNYVIGVWTGSDEGEEIANTSISKKVFQKITNILFDETNKSWYKTGNNSVIEYKINPISGELSSTGSSYFINIR